MPEQFALPRICMNENRADHGAGCHILRDVM
jgi:hypothetical protein